MEGKKIAIIGCGNLGKSILQGILDAKTYPSENITVTKRKLNEIKYLENYGVTVTQDNAKAIQNSDIIILAVKPYNILNLLQELKTVIQPDRHILVSVATGVTIKEIENTIEQKLPVFRAMPNTATDVKESITCICGNMNNHESEQTVQSLFDLIGSTIVINEELMESATVLGACGIAYVLRFIRAMIQGGIQIGFDSKTASTIVNQTVKGAAELLIQRNNHPEHEIDKVTTPKGCTIVGLNEMEHNGFSSSLIKGIVESYKKIEQ